VRFCDTAELRDTAGWYEEEGRGNTREPTNEPKNGTAAHTTQLPYESCQRQNKEIMKIYRVDLSV
jgi:hypothetical protein